MVDIVLLLQGQNRMIQERVRLLAEKNKQLEARVEELKRQLVQKWSNSSKPPSSDPPWFSRKKKHKAGRNPGSQPGHEGHHPGLVDADQVPDLRKVFPSKTCDCGAKLPRDESDPRRHQWVELPEVVEPIIHEVQLFSSVYPRCGRVHVPSLPPGTPTGAFGPRLHAGMIVRELTDKTKLMFNWWHAVRDGMLARSTFLAQMSGLKLEIKDFLIEAICGSKKMAATYHDFLAIARYRWTIVSEPVVEPPTNAAEQALRHAVIWWKVNFGTHSAGGSLYVERVLTVAATCLQQGRNALDYVTAACTARLYHAAAPSLILICGPDNLGSYLSSSTPSGPHWIDFCQYDTVAQFCN